MQTCGVWPSSSGSMVAPQREVELGSSTFFTSRHRRKRELFRFHAGSGCCSFSFDWRYPRSRADGRSSNLELSGGVLCAFSDSEVFLFCTPKKKHFGALVAVSWAVGEHEVSGEVREEPNLVKECIGKIKADDCFDGNSHGREDCGNDENHNDGKPSEGVVEDLVSARIDVRKLASSLQFAKTADDVEEVLKGMDELPLQVHSSVIRGLGKEKHMTATIALYEWLKRRKEETSGVFGPNLFIYNSMLGAVKQSEQFGETEKILTDMSDEGVTPNIVTYNVLMSIYLQQGKAPEALSVLADIEAKGITPTPVSYSTGLLAYRRMEDGHGALKFFVELRDKYRRGEVGKDGEENWELEFVKLENFIIRVCYQVMRRWLVRNESLGNEVLKLLEDMDSAGLQPSRADHEKLVWACTRDDHYAVAKALYGKIREQYSDISLSVCNHLIWLMGKAKKWWAALEIYEDLLDKGPKPNNLSSELIISHFNVLLTAASKRGLWRWGVRMINKMEEKGFKPGSRQWNAVLIACSKASEVTAAVQIFRRMVDQGEKPTIVSYGALLSALEKGKLYDEALRVWDHMVRVGVEPNLYAYTIMASIFTGMGNFRKVDAVFRDMAASEIEPTVVTYNAIISGCARNGMSSAAYEWFHRMRVQNISPNEITYEMLIDALAKDGKPRLAYELYLRAGTEGLDLSSKAYDAVTSSSQLYGATIDVSALGPRPLDKKQKVVVRKTLTEFCNLADVPRRGQPFERNEVYNSHSQANK